jgi:hypothetical protein
MGEALPPHYQGRRRWAMGKNGKLKITVARKGQGITGIYVGRPTPLGNPFRLEREDQREEVVRKYATWLEAELNKGNQVVARALEELYQRLKRQGTINLICFCAPRRCHAEVIAEHLKRRAEAEGLQAEVQVVGR